MVVIVYSVDEAQLVVCGDDIGPLMVSYTDTSFFPIALKVSVIHKMCLLNLSGEHDDDDNHAIILPTEEVH